VALATIKLMCWLLSLGHEIIKYVNLKWYDTAQSLPVQLGGVERLTRHLPNRVKSNYWDSQLQQNQCILLPFTFSARKDDISAKKIHFQCLDILYGFGLCNYSFIFYLYFVRRSTLELHIWIQSLYLFYFINLLISLASPFNLMEEPETGFSRFRTGDPLLWENLKRIIFPIEENLSYFSNLYFPCQSSHKKETCK
jgi:hypothetical protein